MWVRIKREVSRIGVRELWRDGDRWQVSLTNRTYYNRVDIMPDRLPAWKRAFHLRADD